VEIRTSIEINADPGIVWRVMTEVERWPEWTASMQRVRRLDGGEFRMGSEASIKQPRLPETRWAVTELDAGRSFTWEASAPGFRTVARHTIESAGGGSRVQLSLSQAGLLGRLLGIAIARVARRYLDMEAQGLKRRSEEVSSLEQRAEVS